MHKTGYLRMQPLFTDGEYMFNVGKYIFNVVK